MNAEGHSLVRPVQKAAAAHESDVLSSQLHSFELRALRVLLSVLETEERLLDVLLQIQRVESRIGKALAATGLGSTVTAQRIRKERQRLGHQLHTGVGQLLAAIRIQSDIIRKEVCEVPPVIDRGLKRIDSLAHEALDDVRGISRDLYVPEWQTAPLDVALRNLWQRSGVSERFASSIDVLPLPHDPPAVVKALLYRAAQEGISNLIRHAKAKRAHLALASTEGVIEVTVKDDGVGFDAARVIEGSQQTGIGLRALREEAAELGGRLTVSSGPRGTTLTVSVPRWDRQRADPAGS